MARQTQGSMALVGVLAGGIALVAFVMMMVVGDFAFSPAFFLALLIGAGVALFLLRAFHAPAAGAGARAAPEAAPVADSSPAPSPAPAPAPEPAAVPAPAPAPASAAADGSAAPERLDAPREGGGDDLKKIKGVGPKLETMLNDMGFYHFDQIANWSADEVAWVDENLEGFKGRVSRDNWVEQARTLAGGGETEFSQKVDKGDVY